MAETGIVNIRGKEYHTVGKRVNDFRGSHTLEDGWVITTQLLHADEDRVVVKAFIAKGEVILATGHAEEYRGSSNINRTSAMENCETSAIGRALAAAGFIGTEYNYASANEVEGTAEQQEDPVNEAMLDLLKNHKAEVKSLPNCGTIEDAKRTIHSFIKAHLKEWKEAHGDSITTDQIVSEAVKVIKSKTTEDIV